jgi:hypothetical protein
VGYELSGASLGQVFELWALEGELQQVLEDILAIPWLPDLIPYLSSPLAREQCPRAESPLPGPMPPFHRHVIENCPGLGDPGLELSQGPF